MLKLRCLPFFHKLYLEQYTGVVVFRRCTRSCATRSDLPRGRIVNKFPQGGWETLYAFMRKWQKCTFRVELSHLYRPGYKMVVRDFVLAAASTALTKSKKKLQLFIRPPIMWGIDAVSGIYAPIELVFDHPHTVEKVVLTRAYINTVVFGLYWPTNVVIQHASHLLSVVSLATNTHEGVVPSKIRLAGCPELVSVPLHVSLRTPVVDIEDCPNLFMSFKAAHTFLYTVNAQSVHIVDGVVQNLSDAPNATTLFLSLSASEMYASIFFETEWVAPVAKHVVVKNGAVRIGPLVEHCCIYFPDNVDPDLPASLCELELMYTDMDMTKWIADVPSNKSLALSRVHFVHDSIWSNSWFALEEEPQGLDWNKEDLLSSVDVLLQKCAPDALVRVTSLLSSKTGVSVTFSQTQPYEVVKFTYNTDRWTSSSWPTTFHDCIVDVTTTKEWNIEKAAAHLYTK